MRSTMAPRCSSVIVPPSTRSKPASFAKRRPASSTRSTLPSLSKETMRAPTSMAVMSTTSPPSHTAIFEVPPPMSMFMTRLRSRMERADAPEPKAASVVSRPSPAETETNLPACAANSSPIARALARRTATPVRIRAPVSMVEGSMPAASYWRSMNAPSFWASIIISSV